MSRIVVGPFNRVEGDLEVTLDVRDGLVEEARVTTTLYRGFEQLLVGRPSLDALVIAPRICGICSVSQSVAVAAALRGLYRVEPARNGVLATNIAHASENIADHLTHFYLFFMPDFARDDYAERPWFEAAVQRFKATRGTAAGRALPARARLLEIMGILAGKWPHSLAFQPGGTTRAIGLGDKMKLVSIVLEFRKFLEEAMFGSRLDDVLALESLEALEAWAEGPARTSDFAFFLHLARDLGLEKLGPGPSLLMSYGAYHAPEGTLFSSGLFCDGKTEGLPAQQIEEDVSCSWFNETPKDPARSDSVMNIEKPDAYSWAKAPRLAGEPVEVGAVARQAVAGHPLIRDILRRETVTNVRSRVIARVLEIALLTQAMDRWVRGIKLNEPFCMDANPAARGSSVGLVEAARGSLGHWMSVEDGRIAHYQIIAPTTWNFSPRDAVGRPGPLEAALAGTVVGASGAKSVAIQHVVRSFDPCMVCTAH